MTYAIQTLDKVGTLIGQYVFLVVTCDVEPPAMIDDYVNFIAPFLLGIMVWFQF